MFYFFFFGYVLLYKVQRGRWLGASEREERPVVSLPKRAAWVLQTLSAAPFAAFLPSAAPRLNGLPGSSDGPW